MGAMPWLTTWSTSVSIVGRAVMADVASSAENKGTAMNKVADLFVRLGQCGIILAVISVMETRPRRTCERILAISGRAGTITPCEHERESPNLISARKS